MGPLIPIAIGVVALVAWKRKQTAAPTASAPPVTLPKPTTTAGGPYPGAAGDPFAYNPPPPWAADKENPNAGDCGWNGENGDAHLARYMHDRWKAILPPGIETWSVGQVSQWEERMLAKLGGQGSPDALSFLADINALMYGCLGKKILASVQRAFASVNDAYNRASDSTYVKTPAGDFNILPKF